MAVTVRIRNFRAIRDATIKIDGLTVLSGVNNSGKALRNGTLVSTPSGWIPVQELKVGNKVFAGHGGATTISGVYPQGIRDIWKVGFDDGREVFVDGEAMGRLPIEELTVSLSHAGREAYLNWEAYDELLQRDVLQYAIYISEMPFTNVAQLFFSCQN